VDGLDQGEVHADWHAMDEPQRVLSHAGEGPAQLHAHAQPPCVGGTAWRRERRRKGGRPCAEQDTAL